MGISWSGMRKQLEQENICESLKGRVQYFATRYRKYDDDQGRVAILVDGEEVFKSNFSDWDIKRQQAREEIRKEKIEIVNYFDLCEKVHNIAVDLGGFDQFVFYEAFYIYNNQKIEDSLNFSNAIVRLFAILDKRTGKRSLRKLVSEINKQPQWLQYFYLLRMNADKIL